MTIFKMSAFLALGPDTQLRYEPRVGANIKRTLAHDKVVHDHLKPCLVFYAGEAVEEVAAGKSDRHHRSPGRYVNPDALLVRFVEGGDPVEVDIRDLVVGLTAPTCGARLMPFTESYRQQRAR